MKNNKSMMFTLLFFLTTMVLGQESVVVGFDNSFNRSRDLSELPKMDRDIEILKNVLNDMFNQRGSDFYSNSIAEGIHIPGKGVMFNMSSDLGFSGIVLREQLIEKGQADEEQEKSTAEINQSLEEELRDKSLLFLANYANLLSELSNDEQVTLNIDYTFLKEYRMPSNNAAQSVYFSNRADRSNKRMVSTVSKKDLDAFLSGKLDQQGLEEKITIKTIDATTSDAPDVKIMAGIMDDVFNSMADGQFKRRGRTTYTYFEDFGLMYNMKFYQGGNGAVTITSSSGGKVVNGRVVARSSSSSSGTTVVTGRMADEDKEENEEELLKAFEAFQQTLKENVLEYGRTLRSVKQDEVIIINVDLSSGFRQTKLPRSIQMVIPKKLIEDYAKGGISLEKAASSIDIKTMSQSSSSGFPAVFEERVLQEALEKAEEVVRKIQGQN